jgi:Na+/glutamate symporter
MSTDDKYGIGAGLTALGLAAAFILLAQFLKPDVLTFLPHRDFNLPEAIFDGIVCALALPSGIFFFIAAIMSGTAEQETDQGNDQA